MQAAVKAIAWCPHQPNLIASGGGTADRHIRFWNSATGACIGERDTKSQVRLPILCRYTLACGNSADFSRSAASSGRRRTRTSWCRRTASRRTSSLSGTIPRWRSLQSSLATPLECCKWQCRLMERPLFQLLAMRLSGSGESLRGRGRRRPREEGRSPRLGSSSI